MLQEEYNLGMMNDLIALTGLGRDVITYHLDLSTFIDEFFSKAGEKGIDRIHMFGGTAINRAFFGKNQRFSLDMDLNYNGKEDRGMKELGKIIKDTGYKILEQRWMNPKHTLKRLVVSSPPGRAVNFTIDAHFLKEETDAPFENLSLRSITEFFGYPLLRTVVPSYKLEYLLSGKLSALKDRTVDRDVYDSYMGLMVPPDYKLLKKYVEWYDSFPQLVRIVSHKLEKLMEDGKKTEITNYIPEYCVTDFNLMASEISRLLLKMV